MRVSCYGRFVGYFWSPVYDVFGFRTRYEAAFRGEPSLGRVACRAGTRTERRGKKRFRRTTVGRGVFASTTAGY